MKRVEQVSRELRLAALCYTRVLYGCSIVVLSLVLALTTSYAQTQQTAKPEGADPIPQPAVTAILSAFDKYQVVAMPQGHGMQDLNDFILSLIRNPAFSEKVNDIEVEFGNSLYQPMLDRYIAGENVPFTGVQKVWRKTGQPAPGASAFVEQFFPLVRALNQKLPPERRLRVLAGEPPIDWDQIKSMDDVIRLVPPRRQRCFRYGERSLVETSQGPNALWNVSSAAHERSTCQRRFDV